MRRSFRLPRVYPITDTQISGLSHAEQVALFADGGATLVQLRDKHAAGSKFYEEAKAALAVAAERGVRIVINDRVDVALALGGVDVHLGQDDLPPEAARRLLGEDAVIGFSTHNLNQAIEAATWPIDYLAIGPVFTTATKDNPDPIVGFVTHGRGVSVHRRECSTFARLAARSGERVIETTWGAQATARDGRPRRYPVDVEVKAADRTGLLRDIVEALARDRVNVTGMQTATRQQEARMRFTVEVTDAAQLQQTLAAVRSVPGVGSARRG